MSSLIKILPTEKAALQPENWHQANVVSETADQQRRVQEIRGRILGQNRLSCRVCEVFRLSLSSGNDANANRCRVIDVEPTERHKRETTFPSIQERPTSSVTIVSL